MSETAADPDSLVFRLARFVSFFVVIDLALWPIVYDISKSVIIDAFSGGGALRASAALAIVLAVGTEQYQPTIDTDTVWKFCLTTLLSYHVLRWFIISPPIRTVGSTYYPLLVCAVAIGAIAAGVLVSTVNLRNVIVQWRGP